MPLEEWSGSESVARETDSSLRRAWDLSRASCHSEPGLGKTVVIPNPAALSADVGEESAFALSIAQAVRVRRVSARKKSAGPDAFHLPCRQIRTNSFTLILLHHG